MDIFYAGCPPGAYFKGCEIFGEKNKGYEILLPKFKGVEIFFPISPYIFDFADKLCPIFPILGHVVLIKIKRRQYCIPFLAKTVCFRPICYHDQKENHMLCLI